MARPIKKDLATRLSISLPESVANALDRMVSDRGFESRSTPYRKWCKSN